MRTSVRINVIAIFLIFFLINLARAQDSVQVKGPRIAIEEKTFDFGIVPADTLISHVFVIKNAGDDSLKIYRLKSG